MKKQIVFLIISILLSASSLHAKNKGLEEPTEELKWLQRAEEQTNLRSPGAKPFHLFVKFHAFPGMELVPDKKRQIITGDGTYEETWMDLHRWRREVIFGAYHAVETDSGQARKMQANSDYEPVRVLMLLEALLFPVPKNVAWPNREDPALNWKMKRSSVPSADQTHIIDFVQLYWSRDAQECGYYFSYLFLPDGILVQRNDQGLAFGWQDQIHYGEKTSARHISVQAAGRDLLTAQVAIEPVGTPSAELFDQPGNPAEPGMTLRPIHRGEARAPGTDSQGSGIGYGPSYLTTGQVVTSQGEVRELEVIDSSDHDIFKPSNSKDILDMERHFRFYRPAMIDNSPCEMFMNIAAIISSCQH
jgi:hypothetical protein